MRRSYFLRQCKGHLQRKSLTQSFLLINIVVEGAIDKIQGVQENEKRI